MTESDISKTNLRKRIKRLQQRVSRERGEYVPLKDVPAALLLEKIEGEGKSFKLRALEEILTEEERSLTPRLFD